MAPAPLGDLDAEAAEFTALLVLHLREGFRIEIVAVGIKLGEHAVDRIFDEILAVDFADVLILDQGEHPAEGPELILGIPRIRQHVVVEYAAQEAAA